MKYRSRELGYASLHPADAEAEIELLACEMHMPPEPVQAAYNSERAKLDGTARIKT
jgi:hypothetical protein